MGIQTEKQDWAKTGRRDHLVRRLRNREFLDAMQGDGGWTGAGQKASPAP